jgi:hypothetical protein
VWHLGRAFCTFHNSRSQESDKCRKYGQKRLQNTTPNRDDYSNREQKCIRTPGPLQAERVLVSEVNPTGLFDSLPNSLVQEVLKRHVVDVE